MLRLYEYVVRMKADCFQRGVYEVMIGREDNIKERPPVKVINRVNYITEMSGKEVNVLSIGNTLAMLTARWGQGIKVDRSS